MSTKTYTLDQIRKYLTTKSEEGEKLQDAIYDLTEENVDHMLRGKVWKVFGFDNEEVMESFNEEDTTEPDFTILELERPYSEINNTIIIKINDAVHSGLGLFAGLSKSDVSIWYNEYYGLNYYTVQKKSEDAPFYWFLAYRMDKK